MEERDDVFGFMLIEIQNVSILFLDNGRVKQYNHCLYTYKAEHYDDFVPQLMLLYGSAVVDIEELLCR